jgi:NDP-sugar pyrophosphorylase family protein
LKPNPDPRRYGAVVTGPGGVVRAVRRLPRPARGVVSLFTGVQVLDPALLERLPAGPSDIVSSLYAPLLEEGVRLLGLRVEGPWLDFGSPESYLRSQLRLLARTAGRTRQGSLVHARARVDRTALVRRAVVGERSVIGPRASVSRCVLWPGASIGEAAGISACIVTSGARVGPCERLARTIVLRDRRIPLR